MSKRARERGDKRDRWKNGHQDIPVISDETRRTFEAISDPANAHLFTVESALRALRRSKRTAERTQQPEPAPAGSFI